MTLLRRSRKKKIHIVWIVNDLFTNNFITVYQEAKKKEYQTNLVGSASPGHLWFWRTYSKKVWSYLKSQGLKSRIWKGEKDASLKKLKPDYIFTTTPYDDYLPEPLQLSELVKYGKLCSVQYGAVVVDVSKMEEQGYGYTNPFLSRCTYIFRSSNLGDPMEPNMRMSGYLKLMSIYIMEEKHPQISGAEMPF